MKRASLLWMVCAGVVLVSACDLGSNVSGVRPGGSIPLSLAPVFAVVPSDEELAALNLLKVTLKDAGDGTVVSSAEVTIDPSEDEWSIDMTVEVPAGEEPAPAFFAEAELGTMEGEGVSIEWSGRSDPFSVRSVDRPVELRLVLLYRGPLGNLQLESVTLSRTSLRIVEGATSSLQWSVVGDPTNTMLYFGSSNEEVVTVDDTGVVTTKGVGETTIFVFGGMVEDTAVVQVGAPVLPTQSDVEALIDPPLQYVTSDLFISTFHDSEAGESVRTRFIQLRTALFGDDATGLVEAFEAAKAGWRAYGADDAPLRRIDEPQLGVLELTLQRVAIGLNTAFP